MSLQTMSSDSWRCCQGARKLPRRPLALCVADVGQSVCDCQPLSPRESQRGAVCHILSIISKTSLVPSALQDGEMLSWVEDTTGTISASFETPTPKYLTSGWYSARKIQNPSCTRHWCERSLDPISAGKQDHTTNPWLLGSLPPKDFAVHSLWSYFNAQQGSVSLAGRQHVCSDHEVPCFSGYSTLRLSWFCCFWSYF